MPLDPLKHRYGPSVMAIYRSAWRIIAMAKCSFACLPGIVGRMGVVWSYTLAAAVRSSLSLLETGMRLTPEIIDCDVPARYPGTLN